MKMRVKPNLGFNAMKDKIFSATGKGNNAIMYRILLVVGLSFALLVQFDIAACCLSGSSVAYLPLIGGTNEP